MNTDSLADPLDRAPPPRRPGSLRLRLALGLLALNAAVAALCEWSLGGFAGPAEGLAPLAWLVLLLTAAQLLLVEAWLLRPLRRLAAACEALDAAPAPLDDAGAAAPAELGRIGHALRRMRGALWQQEQAARGHRDELARQRLLLEQAHAALAEQQRQLAGLARTDALTGLANQRAFDEALRREFKRAQRQRGLLAVAVLDLDQFRQFNATHGASAGDAALQRVAALLHERIRRDTDVVARLGGEEFVVLLPGAGMAEAQGLLEALRDDLRALRLPDGGGGLTLSVGLAAASPAHPYLSAQALLQAADEALYIAKHAGRDRLSLAA
ncbi:MAG: GGDEF domain-containing protein [Roseateles sp.]|uniref:GGDEF domain-containing protein n=1 Tax=Roseateles sp. TaxID=1971397 RepID=UPI0039ED6B65